MSISYNASSVPLNQLDLYFDSFNKRSVPFVAPSKNEVEGTFVAFLSMNSQSGPDSSNARYYNLDNEGIALSVIESVIDNHATETIGGAVFITGNVTNSSDQVIGESGTIIASTPDENVATTVSLNNTYTDAIVILNAKLDEPTTFVLIVDSVSSNSFDFRIRNWYPPYAFPDEIEISYLVIEKGVHTLSNGSLCEAFESTLTESFEQQNLSAGFSSTPAIIHQVSSLNEIETGEVRIQNVATDGFEAYFQEGNQGSYDGIHGAETSYFLAIDVNSDQAPFGFITSASDEIATFFYTLAVVIEYTIDSLITDVSVQPTNFLPDRKSFEFDGVDDVITSPEFETYIGTEYNHLFCDENTTFTTVVFFKFPSTAPSRTGNDSYALIGCAFGIGSSGTYLFHCNSDNTDNGSTPNHLNVTLRGNNSSVSLKSVKDDTWHMGAVSWDGTTARGYFDGEFTQELSVGDASNQTRGANIGANGGGHIFLGEIGVVMFYKKALSEAEIAQIFESLYVRYES